jgi:prevent-host-death family protein
MTTVTVSHARAHLRSVLRQVQEGEEVVLTQSGQPIAVLLHPSQLRVRRQSPILGAGADRLELLRQARQIRPERGHGLSETHAEALVEEVRRGRDR